MSEPSFYNPDDEDDETFDMDQEIEIYDEQTLQDFLAIMIQKHTANKLRVRTFDSVGMLCMNKGLVITLPEGKEYQLQIVRSG